VLDPDFKLNPAVYNIETANMMLAEDRILCLEIFCRKNFILKYIPDAVCYTDPIKYLIMLMKQRRRLPFGTFIYKRVFGGF
jgi:cellulose synthase/poly-beta-1,6-N-acetylglucosamine synthase-like glycosyltransferase